MISLKEKRIAVGAYLRETDAFKAVVRPAGAFLDIGKSSVISSRWASLDVNRDDPMEVALAARLQHSAMPHVA